MPIPGEPIPEDARRELLAVRDAVNSLLANGTIPRDPLESISAAALPKTIQVFLGRRLIQKTKKARPVSRCRPVGGNDTKYRPKRREIVDRFIGCLKATPERLLERSPKLEAPSALSAKVMTVKFLDIVAPKDGGKDTQSRRLCLSIAIVELCARIVEAADQLQQEQPERFHLARVVMQQSHAAPGFLTKQTTGTGIAINRKGEMDLLPAAIARVEEQLVADAEPSPPESPETTEDEGV